MIIIDGKKKKKKLSGKGKLAGKPMVTISIWF